MARVIQSQVLTLGEGVGQGSAHFTVAKINHETGEATIQGFQLDQYELDSYTMWVNEVIERHAASS